MLGLRAVVLTQYRRVTDGRTDGQTDGITIAGTAFAMRALRRAVKRSEVDCGGRELDVVVDIQQREDWITPRTTAGGGGRARVVTAARRGHDRSKSPHD